MGWLFDKFMLACYVAICVAILLFLIVPTLLVIPMSFGTAEFLQFPPRGFSLRWYAAYLTDDAWLSATWFSVKVALLTAASATVIGNMAAIALVRGKSRYLTSINAILLMPLIVPHIVVAIASYLQFASLDLAGTTGAFVLIHTCLATPYVVIIVSAALQRIDTSYEMAAQGLGASRWRVFSTITAPLAMPAVLAGATFSFLASFDETVVAMFLSGVQNQTLTRKIMEEIDFSLSPIIAAVSTIFIFVTIGIMGLGTAVRSYSDKRAIAAQAPQA
jgi:mannopine transport system permease protein